MPKISFALGIVVLGLVMACGSKSSSPASQKAAAGAPKTATKSPPAKTAPPASKAGTNLTTNTSSAVPDDQVTCNANEEGLGACVDTFALFCASGKAWALDCSAAFDGATCGTLDDGTIDCVIPQ